MDWLPDGRTYPLLEKKKTKKKTRRPYYIRVQIPNLKGKPVENEFVIYPCDLTEKWDDVIYLQGVPGKKNSH